MSDDVDDAPQEGGTEDDASLLGGQEVTLEEGEYFLAENIKGDGEKPDWFNDGKYKTIVDQAKAFPELRKKLSGFTGAPDTYEVPEGIDAEDDTFKAYSEFALKHNMNQEIFNEGFEFVKTVMNVDQEVSAEAELEKLGDNAEQRIDRVEQFLRNNVKDADDYKSIQEMATTAENIMLIEKMMNVLAPKKLPIEGGEHPQGMTMKKVMEMSMKKDEHGRFLRSIDPAYNAKIEKLMKEMGGGQVVMQG